MKAFLRSIRSNFGVVGELFAFLWARKLWWLIPLVSVLLLFMIFAILAVVAGNSPFIYTLF